MWIWLRNLNRDLIRQHLGHSSIGKHWRLISRNVFSSRIEPSARIAESEAVTRFLANPIKRVIAATAFTLNCGTTIGGRRKRKTYQHLGACYTSRVGRSPAEIQLLEQRVLLSGANLQITDAFLVSGTDQEISAPALGQMIFVQANWTTEDLSSSNDYVVRFTVDGVPINSSVITGQAGTGLNYSWWIGGWFATEGNHTVSVVIDGANAILESNELDNTRVFSFQTMVNSDLPIQFSTPIGGVPSRDWTVVNYVDVDPRDGIVADYLGGPFQYDGHNGWDLTLANFASMDRGIPILAAADGIVSAVDDGHFDRETSFNSNPWNFVKIDHGNGWETISGHLAAGTITVAPGQTVVRGQVIGFAGSAGASTDAHLHFMVLHDHALVETNYDQAHYWNVAWPYAGNQLTTLMDAGFTDSNPFNDFRERPATKNAFSRTSDSGASLWVWYRLSQIPANADYDVQWIRPDGAVVLKSTGKPTQTERYAAYAWTIGGGWQQAIGVWQVQLRVNGQLIFSKSILVTDAISPVELRIRDSATTNSIVINGRTTPLEVNSSRTFSLNNYGGDPLQISQILLPEGFSLAGPTPTLINPGNSTNITVKFTATRPDLYLGDIVIVSNDATDPRYSFRIKGTLTGTFISGTPIVTLAQAAVIALPGQSPARLDPLAFFEDWDSPPTAANYRLVAEVVSGFQTGDTLSFSANGYSRSGSNLLHDGLIIGTLGATQNGILSLQFARDASFAEIQSTLRSVSFAAGTAIGGPGQRIIRVGVTDPAGHQCSSAYRTVDVPQNIPPIVMSISRDITSDTSWSGATFNLLNEIHVRSGATLTINSGVLINRYSIIVDRGARIVFSGTTNHPVTLNTALLINDGAFISMSGTRVNSLLTCGRELDFASVILTENSFAPNSVLINPNLVPLLAENTFDTGSTVRILAGTTLTADRTWRRITNVVNYQIIGDFAHQYVTVPAGRTLTINPGNLITDGNYGGFIVQGAGKLVTQCLREGLTTEFQCYIEIQANGHLDSIHSRYSDLGSLNNQLWLLTGAIIDSLTENRFSRNVLRIDPNLVPYLKGNTFESAASIVELFGGTTVLTSLTWPKITNLSTYRIIGAYYQQNITVNSGVTLKIEAGTTITNAYHNGYDKLIVLAGGTLAADSTTFTGMNIVFSGLQAKANITSTVTLIDTSITAQNGAQVVLAPTLMTSTGNSSLNSGDRLGRLSLSDLSRVQIDGGKLLMNDLSFTTSQSVFVSGGELSLQGKSDLNLVRNASLNVSPGRTLQLAGSFLGTTTNSDEFSPLGTVLFKGATNLVPLSLEAMSRDLGDKPAGMNHNFAFETLSLGISTYLMLIDASDNSPSMGSEAVYVNTLIVPRGSTLNLNSLKLYAKSMIVEGNVIGTVTQIVDTTPTNVNLDLSTIPENQPSGTAIGLLTTKAPNSDGRYTYSLVSGEGSQDNSGFSIDGHGTLFTTTRFDFELKNRYSIRVRSKNQYEESCEKVFTINVSNLNDAPVLYEIESTAVRAVGVLMTPVTSSLRVYDQDSDYWTGATITISQNYLHNQDQLVFNNTSKISSRWSEETGTLKLTGTDTVSNYRTALRNVLYHNLSSSPNLLLKRTIVFQANDDRSFSNSIARELTVLPQSDPPTVSGFTQLLTFVKGATPLAVIPNVLISIPSETGLTSAKVSISNWQAGDRLEFSNSYALQHSFTEDPANHTATLSMTGFDVLDHYQKTLRSLVFWNVAGNPVTSVQRNFQVSVCDFLQNIGSGSQAVAVSDGNAKPLVTVNDSTLLTYRVNSPAISIMKNALVTDADSYYLTSLTVQITSGYQYDSFGKDTLTFANQFGITSSFNQLTGLLTLSGVAYVGTYREALRLVKFSTSGSRVSTAPRTFAVIATDDFMPSHGSSLVALRTLSVTL